VRDVLRTKGTFDGDTDVLTAPPSATVYDCISKMAENDFGSIVIMEGEEIVGIFTERDYMKKVALEGRSSDDTAVNDIMTQDVVTVGPEKTLEACLDLMDDLECRHLPVVDEEGQLDDLISVRDCMRQISEASKSEALQLRHYVRGQYPQ
jgi:CBS domain-containing protein